MGKQKYKIVSQLLDETMQEISHNEENWCRFLTTSSSRKRSINKSTFSKMNSLI